MYDPVEKSRSSREVERPTQVATILDAETYAAFVEMASTNERSLAAELRFAVKRYLEDQAA